MMCCSYDLSLVSMQLKSKCLDRAVIFVVFHIFFMLWHLNLDNMEMPSVGAVWVCVSVKVCVTSSVTESLTRTCVPDLVALVLTELISWGVCPS